MKLEYGLPDEAGRDGFAGVLAHAFNVKPDTVPTWFGLAGHENLRVVKRGNEVVGGLFVIPMGQFFGGRSVPMTGIAAVGVRPDAQRRGVATSMMRDAMRELAGEGVALSGLYASTQTLYRKAGYEEAGSRFTAKLRPQDIAFDERSFTPRLPTDADADTVRALYTAVGAEQSGFLDRGSYIWTRILKERRGMSTHGILFEDEQGGLAGYVFYRKTPWPDFGQSVEVEDMCARGLPAYRRVWTFLRDLGTSVVRDITFNTAPNDAAYLVHDDPRWRMELSENWMIRILDVRAALHARGYASSLSARLELEVRDDLLEANDGRFTLEVENGVGAVTDGGRGEIRLDVRALASLYSGFASPATLAQLGRIEGPVDGLRRAAAVFAGASPWMREMF